MAPFPSPHSLSNRLLRAVWNAAHLLLFRPSPRVLHVWRRTLLRCFGARLGPGVHIYPSAKVWAPWNLRMDAHACLGPSVDCYNVAPITIGEFATVSQYAHLCAATHDYSVLSMPLVTRPIQIGARAWVAAGAFVGPGVTLGDGAVVGARSVVNKDVPAWTVVAGNPARVLKPRVVAGGRN
ncbi:MAG: putative colanic acid biosynthesis acetyltransferase [Acidobacteria bacterium]|nr:putative colanic acid biosynthesis acetyltransferase [Acidobacteriota bacterium]